MEIPLRDEIKHVVVDINDFLIVADTKSGAGQMFKNGGILMMAKLAIGDSKELLREFFEAIQEAESDTEYPSVEYFDVILPPILLDSIFDTVDSDIILERINKHLDKTASWMSRSGYKAIAEMSFATAKQPDFRKYNMQNVRLVQKMVQSGYTVHAFGNCSRKSLDMIMLVHGGLPVSTITTSADVGHAKCASGTNVKIYEEWFKRNPNVVPSETLFLEVQQGYRDSAIRAKSECQTMLYRGQNEKADFVYELSERLGLKITLDDLNDN